MIRRITLLAPARTTAQRDTRFPSVDDEIEGVTEGEARAALGALGEVGVVVGGPEQRVAQTAAALGLMFDARAELAAWCSGSWAGRRMTDIATDDPRRFEAWRTDPTASAPGGESLAAFLDRAARWLDDGGEQGQTVAIADNSLIRAVLLHVLGAPAPSFWRIDVRSLSTTVVQGDGSTWRVRSMGEGPRRAVSAG
jgi:broad specificity phosphatase PhoE